ncbi:hypothetical protein [Microbacterium esteraromaticum]|uniref:hypothetical protein n=1 Tax=Microbacterium esteraromaticum TaxID=57043 RepID=UPI0019D39AF0|nr:hypothetical protein [Microbacterium esteraromaticum]MBN7792407.1 hypothetical protein [Microbacterium esteraromaticum]
MSDTLFELSDFEETRPVLDAWPYLFRCGLHRDPMDEAAHLDDCWHGVCPSCGDDVLSPFLMHLNHVGADLGRCQSIELRLNHLTYFIRYGGKPGDRDMSVIDLGWRIAPDGSQIPPAGETYPSGWERHWADAEGFRRWAAQEAVAA